MRPLLHFCAIFKDEAKTVRKTLESVREFIDGYTVIDTGSTDGTQDVVREVFADLPGLLVEEPFVDFATTRNRCLDLAGDGAAFTLTMSADEVLSDGAALRAYLEQRRGDADGAYMLTMRNSGRVWPSPRVLRADARWRYVGDPHEVPEGPDHLRTGPLAPGTVTHDESDVERKIARMRDYDLPRLEKRIADNLDKPAEELATAIGWLAQTHDALGNAHPPNVPGGPWQRHKLAALALYWQRAQIGNPEVKSDREASAYMLFASLQVADKLGFIYAPDEVLGRLQLITEMCPGLAEAHYMAAEVSSRLDPRQGLFLAERAYREARAAVERQVTEPDLRGANLSLEWACLGLAAHCAHALKREKVAREFAARSIAAGGPPERFAEILRAV